MEQSKLPHNHGETDSLGLETMPKVEAQQAAVVKI